MSFGLLPSLTERDDDQRGEGGIDPLNFAPISEHIARTILPGLTERQSHPRYLTALAVGTALCEEVFSDGDVAGDGHTPPYLVFEWLALEGFVRRGQRDSLSGIPGYTKALSAVETKLRLNAETYLKTPGTFGFFGIYRVLAKTLGVERDGVVGDAGRRLLSVWEKERDLRGFIPGSTGSGADLRRTICEGLRDSFKSGKATPGNQWPGWQFFVDHLHYANGGANERRLLLETLLEDVHGSRNEVMSFHQRKDARELWKSKESERQIHDVMIKSASLQLKQALVAIQAYETFARSLLDAFQDALAAMTKTARKTSLAEMITQEPGITESKKIAQEVFRPTEEALVPFGKAGDFANIFSWVLDFKDPKDWLGGLFRHHQDNQKRKPPAGRNPFFDELDSGLFCIRTPYKREQGGAHDQSYVGQYRSRPIFTFLRDLAA